MMMKINVVELQAVLDFMMISRDQNRIECNYCSAGNFVFSDDAESTYDVAKRLINHIQTYHNGRLQLVEEPNEAEIQAAIKSITGGLDEATL